MSPVTLSYANLLSPALGRGGLDPELLDGDLQLRFEAAWEAVRERRERGELGMLELPADEEGRRGVQEVADSFGQWFETLVVVGIGGSALGARAIAEALRGPYWNERSDEAREHYPRIYFLENPDPDSVADLLAGIDPRRTLFNVVSKSGGTLETLAQLLVVEGALRTAVGEEKARGHLLFTTDPHSGFLRRLAGERGIPTLAVPPAVGGRFSVLSAVGLLPAAVIGVDTGELLAGAREVMERCAEARLRENPAGLLATLLHASDRLQGRRIHVLMPYADRLRSLAFWFRQLWAESLGKPGEEGTGVGPTPIAALGAVDQHSLLQLLMEGPDDKVLVTLRVREPEQSVVIPSGHSTGAELALLEGRSLAEILEVERRATVEALRGTGRPSAAIEVKRLDARGLGGLFMFFQLATLYAGALYGVDPLDQPGVEAGKRIAAALLAGGDGNAADPRPEDADGHRS